MFREQRLEPGSVKGQRKVHQFLAAKVHHPSRLDVVAAGQAESRERRSLSGWLVQGTHRL